MKKLAVLLGATLLSVSSYAQGWSSIQLPTLSRYCFLSPSKIASLFSYSQSAVCTFNFSTDTGGTWRSYSFWECIAYDSLNVRFGNDVVFVSDLHGYILGQHSKNDYWYNGRSWQFEHSSGSWIAETTDGGITWSDVIREDDGVSLSLLSRTKNFLYLTPKESNGFSGTLMRLDVRTNNFTNVFTDTSSKRILSSSFINMNVGFILYKSSDRNIHCSKTMNGSTAWSELSLPLSLGDTTYFLCHDSAFSIYLGCNRGVYRSSDFGSTWSKWYNGNDTIVDLAFADAKTIYAIPWHSDYILKSIDTGNSWSPQAVDHSWTNVDKAAAFDSLNAFVYVSTPWIPQPCWKTTNGGIARRPILHFNRRLINLGINQYQDTVRDTVTAYNIGNDTLQVSSLISSNQKAKLTPSSFSIAPNDSMKLLLSFYCNTALTDTATFSFNTNAGNELLKVATRARVAYASYSMSLRDYGVYHVGDTMQGTCTIFNWGVDSLRIHNIRATSQNLIIDSVPSRIGIQEPGIIGFHQVCSVTGSDSTTLIISSNSVRSIDTVLLKWNVLPQASVISGPGFSSSISVFPNPCSSEVQLKTVPEDYPLEVTLFDVLGHAVLRRTTTIDDSELPLNSLSPGAYYALARTASGKEATLLLRVEK